MSQLDSNSFPVIQQPLSQKASSATGVRVITIDQTMSLLDCLTEAVGSHRRPTLVLVGGASQLSDDDFQRIEAIFETILAPLAEKFDLIVVDGGTDAGVMRLMGNARAAIVGTFPLIGVAPVGLVNLPGQPATGEDSADLEPHHTHCFLVPGDQWGDESPWISNIATALAADHASVAILINGGSVTWQDAHFNVMAQRPVVVVAGSGRAADVMAEAIAGHPVDDERALALVQTGLLQSVDLYHADVILADTLKQILRLS